MRNYTARAQNCNQEEEKLNFWQRISQFNLRSQQRRYERFLIIYTWKVIENLAPNCGLEWEWSERNGRNVVIPNPTQGASTKVKSLRTSSFQIRGPKLFNSIPLEIRNLTECSVNTFKNRLDCLLNMIPDTPTSQKYHPAPLNNLTSRSSNSILEWVQYLNIPTRRAENLTSILDNLKLSNKFLELKAQLNLHIGSKHTEEMQDTEGQLQDENLEISFQDTSTHSIHT